MSMIWFLQNAIELIRKTLRLPNFNFLLSNSVFFIISKLQVICNFDIANQVIIAPEAYLLTFNAMLYFVPSTLLRCQKVYYQYTLAQGNKYTGASFKHGIDALFSA